MCKFVRYHENGLINVNTITKIEFDPSSERILRIHVSDPRILLLYSDDYDDRKCIRDFIDDLRYHFTLTDQPPSFWDLMCDIERWLDEREVQDAN